MGASTESNEVTTTVKLEQIQTFEEGMAQHDKVSSKAKWACFSNCVENLPVITSRLLSQNLTFEGYGE